jgi:hypothetical protein
MPPPLPQLLRLETQPAPQYAVLLGRVQDPRPAVQNLHPDSLRQSLQPSCNSHRASTLTLLASSTNVHRAKYVGMISVVSA